MSSISDLLSDAVVGVETRATDIDDSLLWPEEAAALGKVVEGRRRDYVLGRRCARVAIETLGLEPGPILSGERREPLWPGGLVGAITHTAGYAAAAVARQREVASVGIDAEPDEPLPPGVLRRVARADELPWVERDPPSGVGHADRLLFSAKEAVYKAWYPLAGRWLGFEDARLTMVADEQRFVAELLVEPLTIGGRRIDAFHGRYASHDGVILTTVEVGIEATGIA